MGQTSRYNLARLIIFLVSTFSLLYAIFVAAISFARLNITASHLSQPLLIGYSVFWLVVAPSGLWGFFGSIQNNKTLLNRYLKDHWFSSAFITTVDILKIIFSFTMKENSINNCSNGVGTAISRCRKKVEFHQKAGLVAFGAQEFLLIGMGLLIWYSCKHLMQKKEEKIKVLSERDLEEQRPRGSNNVSTINDNNDLRENTTNPPLPEYNKGQNEKEPVSNIENPRTQENDKKMQGSEQQQQQQQQQNTTPQRPHRKSYDRQMTSFDELQARQRQGPPPQGMNPNVPNIRSNIVKVAHPIVRSNTILPHEYRPIQPIQYSQLQTSMVPPHFNGPLPPQFRQLPNFQPSYPWQELSDDPRGATRLGHRRSRSHPQLRPLPAPPIPIQQVPPIPPQILKQKQAIQPQIIERKQQAIPLQTIERQQQFPDLSKRRGSTSSRYRPIIIEQNRPISQIHRTNSLPNLYGHEHLMRNELLSAPPVPAIPPSLQPGNNNNKPNDKDAKESKQKPPTINNAEKLERFIKLYGNKEYNMNPYPQYNKYSEIQPNIWNTQNNDYVPQTRPRPTSAHSVRGEPRPKSSASSAEVSEDGYYNDHYYYEPSSGYIMNQTTMNNNNYAYTQYIEPIYGNGNNGGNFVRSYNGGDNSWINYGQQRSQEPINYYY